MVNLWLAELPHSKKIQEQILCEVCILSRSFVFLAQSKDVHGRVTGDSKLAVGEWLSASLC